MIAREVSAGDLIRAEGEEWVILRDPEFCDEDTIQFPVARRDGTPPEDGVGSVWRGPWNQELDLAMPA